MALITRYVDPTATGANNGTSWTDAYTSLAAWNTAEANDLVTNTNNHDVYCRGGADTVAAATTINMSGWTTNSTYFVRIIGEALTTGKLDTSKYYLDKTVSATGGGHILSPAGYTQVLNLQFRFRNNTGANTTRACVQVISGRNGVKIGYCVFDCGGTSSTTAGYAISIDGAIAGTGNTFVSDNIIIDSNTFGHFAITSSLGVVADRVKIYNNTFINTNGGTKTAVVGNKNFKLVNNIFQGWSTDTATALETGTNYNLTNNGSFPAGANNVVSTTLTFVGGGDYKLSASDTAAIGAGIGPSSDSQVQTTDFNGDARSGTTTDIGADLYVSAAPTPSITSTSDDTPTNGSTLTLTGTGFESSQGTGGVTAGGVGWTETSWAATSISVTVALGDNKYNANVPLVVTNNSGNSSSAYNVQIQPASGVSYVNLSGTLASSGDRITAVSDLASGDQLEISNVVGGVIGDVTVNVDASFSVASGVTSFDVRANDGTGWGTVGTQTVGTAASTDNRYTFGTRKSKRVLLP